MSTIFEMVSKKTQELGWKFQEPYVNALKLIVTRRRDSLNPDQLLYWMAEATLPQRCEAYQDALAIIEVTKDIK